MYASLLLLTFLAAAPAGSSPQDLVAGDVATELHRINQSLQTLVNTVTAQADRSRIELMLRRAELTAQELVPVTAELRSVRQSVEIVEEEIRVARAQLRLTEESAADPQTPDRELKGIDDQIRRWKDELERSQARVKRMSERMSVLEADSAAKNAEVEQIKVAVDRVLFAPNP